MSEEAENLANFKKTDTLILFVLYNVNLLEMRQAADCALLVNVLQCTFSPQGVSMNSFKPLILFS